MPDKPLRVIYICRKWFKDWTIKSLKCAYNAWRNKEIFVGQDGFFEAALFSACNVDHRPLSWAMRNKSKISSLYDAVVVNSKCAKGFMVSEEKADWLDSLTIPKVLFLGGAQAWKVPSDTLLNKFDLVYKREMLRDLNSYPVSESNRRKFRTTMLSCPIVQIKKSSPVQISEIPEARKKTDPYEYDVFFSGSVLTNPCRQIFLERLRNEPFQFFGGFQGTRKKTDGLKLKVLDKQNYMNAIRRSRINLALEGWGEFTHRHLEIWCLGGFCLSAPSIKNVTLPFANPQEGLHYAAFDNPDDMVDKVKYYLSYDDEREKIAASGRALFEQIYDPIRHGEEIKKELQQLI